MSGQTRKAKKNKGETAVQPTSLMRALMETRRADGLPLEAQLALQREAPGVRRFQLIERTDESLALRLNADDREAAFIRAEAALQAYLRENGVETRIALSECAPQPDARSGKFRHILRER